MSERMPKIYLYINVLGGGGAERVIANLANTLAEDGCETTLITSFPVDKEYSIDKKVRRLLLEDHEFRQSRLKRNVTRISKLRKICKEEKPDILISFMEEPNFRAILATRGLPVKTLVSVRNDPNKEYAGKLGAFVGKVLLPMADGCVFQTKEGKNGSRKGFKESRKSFITQSKKIFIRLRERLFGERLLPVGVWSNRKIMRF